MQRGDQPGRDGALSCCGMDNKSASGSGEGKPAQPPTEKELLDRADQVEDDRLAAEEAGEVEDEDEAVVEDAREERVP